MSDAIGAAITNSTPSAAAVPATLPTRTNQKTKSKRHRFIANAWPFAARRRKYATAGCDSLPLGEVLETARMAVETRHFRLKANWSTSGAGSVGSQIGGTPGPTFGANQTEQTHRDLVVLDRGDQAGIRAVTEAAGPTPAQSEKPPTAAFRIVRGHDAAPRWNAGHLSRTAPRAPHGRRPGPVNLMRMILFSCLMC